jgi:hypothetical protein
MSEEKEKLIFDFFMWFRSNGEHYVHISIEEMIKCYLKQKKDE